MSPKNIHVTEDCRAISDGLIMRKVFPTVPPRVDYALTALGRSQLEPVNALSDWTLARKDKLADARDKFDKSVGPA